MSACLCAGRVEVVKIVCYDKPHAESVASVNDGEISRNPASAAWEVYIYKRLALVWENNPKDPVASWVKLTQFCRSEGWHPFRVLGNPRDPLGLVRRTMAENAHNSMPVNIEE